MYASMNIFLDKHENLSQNFQHLCKKPSVLGILSAGGVEWGRWIMGLLLSAQLLLQEGHLFVLNYSHRSKMESDEAGHPAFFSICVRAHPSPTISHTKLNQKNEKIQITSSLLLTSSSKNRNGKSSVYLVRFYLQGRTGTTVTYRTISCTLKVLLTRVLASGPPSPPSIRSTYFIKQECCEVQNKMFQILVI